MSNPLFRRHVSCTLVAMLAFSSMHISVASAADTPSLVIGEIAWAGSSASSADEWIELWNLSDTSISLNGYQLEGAGEKALFFPMSATVPPYGTYVISNYDDTDPKSTLSITPELVTSSIALSNTSLHLLLRNGVGTLIDEVGDGQKPAAGSTGEIKASMIRQDTGWISATSSAGFDESSLDLGTPGMCDGCKVVPSPSPNAIDPIQIDDDETETASSNPSVSIIDAPSDFDSATSSEALPEVDVSTSTVDEIDSISVADTATTTEDEISDENEPGIGGDASTSTFSTQSDIPSSTVLIATPPPPYELLRISRFMPAPSSGSEWIEISSLDASATIPLEGVQLTDADDIIFTFASGTLDATTTNMRVTLSRSRLNNDGDVLSLISPSGTVLDAMSYDETKHDIQWIRVPENSGPWQMDLPPVPPPPPPSQTFIISTAATNLTASTKNTNTATSTASLAVTTSTQAKSTTIKQPPKKKTTTVKKISGTTVPTTSSQPSVRTSKAAIATATVPKKNKPIKTTKTVAKPKKITPKNLIHPSSFSMLEHDASAGLRVSLQGLVGTPSGLLSGHDFILLSGDGRGLRVRVPRTLQLPSLGSVISVTGNLKFNNQDVPELTMQAADSIRQIAEKQDQIIRPRLVDLTTPSSEDAWSLVQVTGTVQDVRATSFTMNLDDLRVTIPIKPVIGYRVQRLRAGDTVRVMGVIETTGQDLRIFPRDAEEIELLSHASTTASATNRAASATPPWIPFAAAGGLIVGNEGIKRMHKRYREWRLEKKLEEAT